MIKLVAGTLAPRPAGEISISRETGCSALIDGGQRVGMVIMRKAVDLAIQKAKNCGMSCVGITNYASATGALGVWGRDIARAGLIGFVFSQVLVCMRELICYVKIIDNLLSFTLSVLKWWLLTVRMSHYTVQIHFALEFLQLLDHRFVKLMLLFSLYCCCCFVDIDITSHVLARCWIWLPVRMHTSAL